MEMVLRLDRNWPISPNISTTTGPLFVISQGTLPWQPIFGKICEMTFTHFKTGCTIGRLIGNHFCTSRENLVRFG